MQEVADISHRSKIAVFEEELKAKINSGELPDKLAECTLRHFHIPGGYARELTIPAGLVVIGKIHKKPCVNIVSKGRILVSAEGKNTDIIAPYTFVSGPGVKRVVMTLEETVWTTFHVTKEVDVDKIEEDLVSNTYDDVNFDQVEFLE